MRPASAWVRRGAAPKQRDLERVVEMVEAVKALGLETCATLGMLNDGAGRALRGGRSRLLQPQPRHLAGVLRRHHQHAHLRGPARHAGAGAGRGHPRLLRRHRRHGRDAPHRARADRATREPRSVSRERADQQSGAGRGHAARTGRRRSIRSNSSAPSPCARITMPTAFVRLSAGREAMPETVQALCFLAGANSDFLRREAAHHRQPGDSAGPGALRQAWPARDAVNWRCGSRSAPDAMPLPDLVA